VLRDTEVADQPYMVFSGDTLFAGDIARTDFFGQERKMEMAEKIFDSITNKILPLGDGVILCPAHGAGSVCGEAIADHAITTSDMKRRQNPSLTSGRKLFISGGQPNPLFPPLFPADGNFQQGWSTHPAPVTRPASPDDPARQPASGNRVVRSSIIRSPTSFGAGHIPGSISIWREGLPVFMGWVLDYQRPIVIVDDFNLDLDRVCRHFAPARVRCRRRSTLRRISGLDQSRAGYWNCANLFSPAA